MNYGNSMRVMVFGTFDGLHAGHLFLFQQAKELASTLTVVVGRDQRIAQLKKRPPVHTEEERLMLVESISLVDKAILGYENDVYRVVSENQPDFILLGYDQTFFTDKLEEKIQEFCLNTKVVRAKKFLDGHHKSSKIRTQQEEPKKFRQFIVPVAFVIQDGKLLMTLRNDPENPRFHKKWELPGGKLHLGESLEECVIRETKEEVDYDVEVITELSRVTIMDETEKKYQVCLIPLLCRIVGGQGNHSDREVLKKQFFALDEVLSMPDLIPENHTMFTKVFDEIKQKVHQAHL